MSQTTPALTNDQARIAYAAEYLGWDATADADANAYFTVANMVLMFGDDAITDQALLDEIAAAVYADHR